MEPRKNVVVEKSYEFAIAIVHLSSEIALKNPVLANQLLRSGTSVGANINEAQAALTRKEFAAKMSIAAKEMREARYWLMLLKDTRLVEKNESIENLADELVRLLTSIVKSAQVTASE
jgi:four helix bundle protein